MSIPGTIGELEHDNPQKAERPCLPVHELTIISQTMHAMAMTAIMSQIRILIAAVIVARVRVPRVRVTRRREVRRRRPAIIGATAVHVRVRRIVARSPVGVIVPAAGRWVVIQGRSAARRRTVDSPAVIIVVPARGRGALPVAVPITIPTGAVSARREAPVIVIHRREVMTARRARATPIPVGLRLRLLDD